MAEYRIHRMKESVRQQFRWSPHTIGTATAKPKDYEPAGLIEAPDAYAAWTQLKDSDSPLLLGDILESGNGELRIFKFVGFEEAQWQIPEIKTSQEVTGAAAPTSE